MPPPRRRCLEPVAPTRVSQTPLRGARGGSAPAVRSRTGRMSRASRPGLLTGLRDLPAAFFSTADLVPDTSVTVSRVPRPSVWPSYVCPLCDPRTPRQCPSDLAHWPPDLCFDLVSVGPRPLCWGPLGARLQDASGSCFMSSDTKASQSPAPCDGATSPSPSRSEWEAGGLPERERGCRCGGRVPGGLALWGPGDRDSVRGLDSHHLPGTHGVPLCAGGSHGRPAWALLSPR